MMFIPKELHRRILLSVAVSCFLAAGGVIVLLVVLHKWGAI